MNTLTYPEASRARESAWRRFESATADHNSWARTIAMYAMRDGGFGSGDHFLVARAAEMEAHADWVEARERCAAVAAA